MEIVTTVLKGERRIVTTYTEGTYRVKVSTAHSKNYKIYRSIVSECEVRIEATYSMETSIFGVDYHKGIQSVPTKRYDFAKLEEAHASAVKLATKIEFGESLSLVTKLFANHDLKLEEAV